MKKRIYIAIAMVVVMASQVTVQADITFTGKETLFFNAATTWTQPTVTWNDAGACFSAYFYRGTNPGVFAGKAVQIVGDVYAVTIPAGTWSGVVLTRHAGTTTVFDWDGSHGFWNQSCDIDINQYNWDNYISNFNLKDHGTGVEWKLYSPTPKNGTTPQSIATNYGITIEEISICNTATGDPFSLNPKILDDMSGFDDDFRAHAWFKTTDNGSTWSNVDGLAGERASSAEGDKYQLSDPVGAYGTTTYYYLFAKNTDKQRIIKASVDRDCNISCAITSFEVTPTAVNVNDNTYTIDGMVAFTKADGNLIIECDGKTETITSPSSPQEFSLKLLEADGNTDNIRAYFSSNPSCYSETSLVAPTPTSGATIHGTTTSTPKSAVTLTPDGDGSNDFEWVLNDGTVVSYTGGTDNKLALPVLDYDDEVTYIYTEYNPLPTYGGDLMGNGDYEQTSFPYNTTSDYSYTGFWGGINTKHDAYDSGYDGQRGLFGITVNANTFWKFFANVYPKAHNYLAVIDGDENSGKAAWKATTDANNPNLKIQKGTTYLFSFWVANVNNFGELINNGKKNCAILQFHIKCKDKITGIEYEADLGSPIDLGDDMYMDNLWHQNSATFSTLAKWGIDFDADEVTISVEDKNNNGVIVGNDFALDDIQFRAVSVVSKSVKAKEVFKVKYEEPQTTVNAPIITITQTPSCGNTDFTMQAVVSYSTLNNKYPITLQLTDNVYGDIFTTPIAIDPLTNPNSITLTLPTATYSMLVADGNSHTLTAKIERLDGHGVDKGGTNAASYIAPGVPAIHTPTLTEQNKACDKTTFDLQVATEYLAFKGSKLSYEWDGTTWTDIDQPTLSYKESTWQTATGKLKNLTADGQNHTLRVYSDNALDCDVTIAVVTAPYMPEVTVVTAAAVHSSYTCSSTQYRVHTTATFANSQAHDIVFEAGDGQKVTKSTALTDTEAEADFLFDWGKPTTPNIQVYFVGAESCGSELTHNKTFAIPSKPALSASDAELFTSCDNNATYNLQLSVSYTNQKGSKWQVSIDGGTAQEFAIEHPNAMTAETQTLTINGLTGDGGSHTYSITTDNTEDCSLIDQPFTAPYRPTISNVKSNVQAYTCSSGQYEVKIEADYTNSQAHDIIFEDWNGNKTNLSTSGDGHAEETFALDWDMTETTRSYKVYFVGAESCIKTTDYQAPSKPRIVSVTPTLLNTGCGTTQKYDLQLDVVYVNQNGTLHADCDGVSTTEETGAIVENNKDPQTATITLTGLDGDGLSHAYNLWFDGSHGCSSMANAYTAPYMSNISAIAYDIKPYACNDVNYTVEITVDFTLSQGHNLVITDGAGHTETLTTTNSDTQKSAQFTLPIATTLGSSHSFLASFDGAPLCMKTVSYTEPVIAKVSAVTATPSTPAFGETKYDVTVDVTYTNGQKKNITIRSTDLATPLTWTGAVSENGNGSASHTFTNIETDNGVTHQFEVFFEDATACADNDDYISPIAKAFTTFTAIATPKNCDTEYDLSVAGTFAALGGNLVINDLTDSKEIYNQTAPTGTSFGFDVTDFAADGKLHQLEAYFTSDPTYRLNATYTAPNKPSLALSHSFGTIDCDGRVTATVGINFENQTGDLVITDENDAVLTTRTTTATGSETYLWLMDADGGTHTVKAYFTSLPSCIETHTIVAPNAPTITITKDGGASQINCDGSYTLVYSIVGANDAADIVVRDNTTGTTSTYSSSAPFTVSVSGTQKAATTLTALDVWFVDRTTCVFNSTAETILEAVSLTPTVTAQKMKCGGTFDIDYNITFSGQRGDLIIKDNGIEVDRQSTVSSPYHFVETDVAADASTHHIEIYFAYASACAYETYITAPQAMQIISADETHSEPYCKETDYELTWEIAALHPQADIIIEDNGVEVHRFAITPTMGLKYYDVTLTLTTDESVHNIDVYYDGYDECAYTTTYTAPSPHICIEYYDTICVGETYRKHGLSLLAQTVVGDFEYQVKDSTTFLHVIDMPDVNLSAIGRVCNTETTLSIPFAVVAGEPNRYSVTYSTTNPSTIGDLTGEVLPSAATLTLPLPADLAAGVYNATLHFYSTGASCSTDVDYQFEVSEDGLVFSKWDDVLLINNGEDRFTSFQWYEDGVRLDGETAQRLYNAEGLNGTYYCLLTTTDGTIITTCEITFAAAPRSAELSKQQVSVSPKQVNRSAIISIDRTLSNDAMVRVVSTTGQVVNTYMISDKHEQIIAPADAGMYIVIIDESEERYVEKIIVN